MKIDKTTPPLPASQIGELAPKSANARPTGGSAPANTRAPANETSVHLGNGSAQLRSMESHMANSPAVDKEKVEAIKKAISEGRFQVNPAAIVDNLINSVQELIEADKSGRSHKA